MGMNFVTEIDSVKFGESMNEAFASLNSKKIVSVEFSTAAVPKPLEVGQTVSQFDFITEYSAIILWTEKDED